MEIDFRTDIIPPAWQVAMLYERSGLPRPVHDHERLNLMLRHASLVVTAWHEDRLVGVSRCISDWAWCSYLSDLAVDPDYKENGIGKKLVAITKEKVGDCSMLLLLSVPSAMNYYPKIGFTKEDRGFIINREK